MESFYDTLQAYRYLVGLEVVENEDFPTVYVGPGNILVAAHVVFDGGLATAEIDECISAIQDALQEADPDVDKVYIEPLPPGVE
jgi:divalent metal cation (Fe/Co/Zn/Cd) transporter